MSTNSQDQEIDLGQIGTGIKNFFSGIVNSIFDFIFFVKRKIVIIIGLLIIGLVLGYFLDKTTKKYTSEIIVAPNIGGSDYLYSKINLIKSKLKEDDKSFFKSIGISDIENVLKIELDKSGLNVQSQIPLNVVYEGQILDIGFRADLLVENKVIIEIKSVEEISAVHHKQLLTYLKLTNKKLGILVNFNTDYIDKSIYSKQK